MHYLWEEKSQIEQKGVFYCFLNKHRLAAYCLLDNIKLQPLTNHTRGCVYVYLYPVSYPLKC